jgi:hypothetical protein
MQAALDAVTICIDACDDCAGACVRCADACLAEDAVADLARCVRGSLDCADICATTSRELSRHAGQDHEITRAFLDACATACRLCAAECERHAHLEHCRSCAEACRRCEEACRQLLG